MVNPAFFMNAGHRISIDWIISRDGEKADTVGHDDMLSLPDNLKSGLFERADCVKVIDAEKLRHGYSETSTSLTSCFCTDSATAARYSGIASLIFSMASCSVFPCD